MSPRALLQPKTVKTNRSQLRQNQSSILRKATGGTVVLVTARQEEEQKLVMDKKYFEQILQSFRATLETLAITKDPRLFGQLLRAGETLDDDARSGKLRSFEDAFGEE